GRGGRVDGAGSGRDRSSERPSEEPGRARQARGPQGQEGAAPGRSDAAGATQGGPSAAEGREARGEAPGRNPRTSAGGATGRSTRGRGATHRGHRAERQPERSLRG